MSTGGLLARYAAEGAHVCLVTCTNGEVGEIAEIPDLGTPDEIRPRLGEIRVEELREACRRLGVEDLRLLGYHDSGMAGTPENAAPEAFVNQPVDAVVERLVAIIREVRPQVAVTYNEDGFYGHPDHIKAHEATLAAIPAAAEGSRFPHAGAPWQVSKLYYTAVPKSRLRMARQIFQGDDGPRWSEEDIERIGTDDELIAARVDVSDYVKAKFYALEAHRTQMGTTQWFLNIPEDVRVTAMGAESYVLASTTLPRPAELEDDLFEGVPS